MRERLEITFEQAEYAQHSPIRVSKERARRHWLPATEREITALREVNGSLTTELVVHSVTSGPCSSDFTESTMCAQAFRLGSVASKSSN